MNTFQNIILIAPVLLFSVVAHEYAHGYVALKNGDMTAYQLGRLTWNPVKHIDPFMTIILPLMMALGTGALFGAGHRMILGGAKPIPVNPRNYRNFKKGDIAVSLAGVSANLAIAVICAPVFVLVYYLASLVPALAEPASIFQLMLLAGIEINIVLAAFNLLPIPPLDGSHVMKYLLPPAWGLQYQQIGRFGLVVLILLLTIGAPILRLWFLPAESLMTAIERLIGPYMIVSKWTV